VQRVTPSLSACQTDMSRASDDRSDLNTRDAWDAGAAAWDDFVESGADYYRTEVHGPGLLAACGDVSGLVVLDLGCGQGWFSRRLAQRGAKVTGVELAENQIANARRREGEAPLGIDYRQLDATTVHRHFPAGAFDLVTALMSIQDMDDSGAALKAAHTVLKPGGRMLFSTPHPFTDTAFREWERDAGGNKLALKVDRYFESSFRTLDWNMERLKYHWQTPQWRRPLSEWSALISEAGFLTRRLLEPRATPGQVEAHPELDDCARLPYFLVFDLVKP
jgi:2-polyprenyl-3-methyl-5-hydroxy-6-metoxy-1,4-benzoquinol methylase